MALNLIPSNLLGVLGKVTPSHPISLSWQRSTSPTKLQKQYMTKCGYLSNKKKILLSFLLFFADDVFLFAKADANTIQTIKNTIHNFCETSKMNINLEK